MIATTTDTSRPGKQPAEVVSVRRADLPLSCPRPGDALWNMHPRVYLPIEDEPNKEAICPYCGAHYHLMD